MSDEKPPQKDAAPREHDSAEKFAGKWPVEWGSVPEGAKRPVPERDQES